MALNDGMMKHVENRRENIDFENGVRQEYRSSLQLYVPSLYRTVSFDSFHIRFVFD